jgi:hypothetical protein
MIFSKRGSEHVDERINFEFPGEAIAFLNSFRQPDERLFLFRRSNTDLHEVRCRDVIAARDFRI